MPQLGESVVEGTVLKWLKKEGEEIEEFEPILEINTDKVDTEVPSPASGKVLKIYVDEGQTVRAGSLLAIIGEEGEQIPEDAPGTQPSAKAPTKPKRVEAAPVQSREEREDGLGFISPVVARIAAEHDLDLRRINGTGRGGRITKKDVLAYVESLKEKPERSPWEEPATGELFRPSEEVFGPKVKAEKQDGAEPAHTPGSTIPIDIVRKTIAEHMVRSKKTSPHVSTVMEVDLSRVVEHRQVNKDRYAQDGVNLTFTTYFVAAAVAALKAWPIVNSTWGDEGIRIHKEINIGIAVSLQEKGLIVPVIKGADQQSLLGLSKSIGDLATRARERSLRPEDVQGGTFTITNHGVAGSLFATPIIHQPQAAILGVGKIQKRVVVIETGDVGPGGMDAIAIRPMAYLTLSFDHRILDGAIADAFLGEMVSRLEGWT
jgi:2-oxoglutarate dehydrogenase E2 component (dihydrolipoamide succinyltransferase)